LGLLLNLIVGCSVAPVYSPKNPERIYLQTEGGRLSLIRAGEVVKIEEDHTHLVECSSVAVSFARIARESYADGRYSEGAAAVTQLLAAYEEDPVCASTSSATETLRWVFDEELLLQKGPERIEDLESLKAAVTCVPESTAFADDAIKSESRAKLLFWTSFLSGVTGAVGLTTVTSLRNENGQNRNGRAAGWIMFVGGTSSAITSAIIGSWYTHRAQSDRHHAANSYNDALLRGDKCVPPSQKDWPASLFERWKRRD